jgi:predicted PurR-regulated permease PerM
LIIIIVIYVVIIIIIVVVGKMIIQALPEIPTKGLTLDDLDSLMERTRNVMSETYQSLLTEVMAQAPPSYPLIKQ